MATSDEAQRLNQRINAEASKLGIPAARVRTRIAFQRILARLASSQDWVLTGGFSLELRLGLRARATRDLDLWRRQMTDASETELLDALEEALEQDLGDGFTFQLGKPRRLGLSGVDKATWRTRVQIWYFTSPFADVRVDIAKSAGETSTDVSALAVEPLLVGDSFSMSAINLNRHAAEKFHACLRVYAFDRPSSRVKDLIDLVLLIEGGWLDRNRLGLELDRVYEEREGMSPPVTLPDQPPKDWFRTYPPLAAETGITHASVEQGWFLASKYYRAARNRTEEA